MAVFDKMTGISVASGFKLQAKAPLDVRSVVDTIADRDLLVTENGAYEGMKVYVKENKTTYELKGTTNSDWSAVGGDVAADLGELQSSVEGLETDVGELQTDVGELQTDVGALETSNAQAFKSATIDNDTGIITFTRNDNSTYQLDTLLEKVVVNFSYDEDTQSLILELEDGTEQTVSLAAFIDTYTGVDGTTITVTVSGGNQIGAEVKDGTITLTKLHSDVQAELAKIQDGSTTQKGLVQLSDTVSDDSTTAATPKAVNTVKAIADTASSTATTAAGDAATALNTANTAKSTAEAAAEDAEEAATNASTALSTAGEAKTTAEGAASDAGTALSTANTAKTTADGAASAAATAQSTAEGAASAAQTAATAASTAQATADSKVKVVWVEQGGEAPGTAEANSLCFRIL